MRTSRRRSKGLCPPFSETCDQGPLNIWIGAITIGRNGVGSRGNSVPRVIKYQTQKEELAFGPRRGSRLILMDSGTCRLTKLTCGVEGSTYRLQLTQMAALTTIEQPGHPVCLHFPQVRRRRLPGGSSSSSPQSRRAMLSSFTGRSRCNMTILKSLQQLH